MPCDPERNEDGVCHTRRLPAQVNIAVEQAGRPHGETPAVAKRKFERLNSDGLFPPVTRLPEFYACQITIPHCEPRSLLSSATSITAKPACWIRSAAQRSARARPARSPSISARRPFHSKRSPTWLAILSQSRTSTCRGCSLSIRPATTRFQRCAHEAARSPISRSSLSTSTMASSHKLRKLSISSSAPARPLSSPPTKPTRHQAGIQTRTPRSSQVTTPKAIPPGSDSTKTSMRLSASYRTMAFRRISTGGFRTSRKTSASSPVPR